MNVAVRVALSVAVLAGGCGAASSSHEAPRRRHAPIALTREGSAALREAQTSEEASAMSALLWDSDSESPSIWAFTGSRDYFVPRVGLRFVLPIHYALDASSPPSQHAVLEGRSVPHVARGGRLHGDRTLRIRGDGPHLVTVSLLEIPMSVEPATFCAWAAAQLPGRPAVARDTAESIQGATTRLCEMVGEGGTTRVRGFLRAGWLLAFSQAVDRDGASPEMDALVASVRAFD